MLSPYNDDDDAHTTTGFALSSSLLLYATCGAAAMAMAAGLSSVPPSFPHPTANPHAPKHHPWNCAYTGPTSAPPEPPVNSAACATATGRADKGSTRSVFWRNGGDAEQEGR